MSDSAKVSELLEPGETLLWSAPASRRRLMAICLFCILIGLVLTTYYSWVILSGKTLLDLCGPLPSISCKRGYVLSSIGLAVGLLFLAFSCAGFIIHSTGMIRRSYLMTNRRLAVVREGLISSTTFANGPPWDAQETSSQIRFGSGAQARMIFHELSGRDRQQVLKIAKDLRKGLAITPMADVK